MKMSRRFAIACAVTVLPPLVGAYVAATQEKKQDKGSVCSLANPQGVCNPSTTCGSRSTPCVVDIKRTDYSAAATPNIPDWKENAPFCVRAGTTITWQSSSKDTGFVLDFSQATPFEPQTAIIGGSEHSVSVVAKKPGCFKYSVGACRAGATYGMCDSAGAEIVVTAGGN